MSFLTNFYKFNNTNKILFNDTHLIKKNTFYYKGYFDFASFLEKSTDKIKLKDINNKFTNNNDSNFKIVINKLKNIDLKLFMVDMSKNYIDIKNLFITRVFISKIQPYTLENRIYRLAGRRLYDVPVKMGYLKKPLSYKELNIVPHPNSFFHV